jgi:uncharacterized protein (TIGR03437 family)
VANSASLNASGQVSPGEIISIVGIDLGPSTPVSASLAVGQQALRSQLGGVQVFFDGVSAPLLYVSSTQINAIVPFGTANRQETRMVVENAGASSNEARLGVVPAAPAVFVMQATYQYLPVAPHSMKTAPSTVRPTGQRLGVSFPCLQQVSER